MQLKTPTEGDTVGPLLVLCLHPLNGWAREPKRIPLTANPVVIGRHTSVKTAPKETNGFFSAKVLSRAHAEVWAAGGQGMRSWYYKVMLVNFFGVDFFERYEEQPWDLHQ